MLNGRQETLRESPLPPQQINLKGLLVALLLPGLLQMHLELGIKVIDRPMAAMVRADLPGTRAIVLPMELMVNPAQPAIKAPDMRIAAMGRTGLPVTKAIDLHMELMVRTEPLL